MVIFFYKYDLDQSKSVHQAVVSEELWCLVKSHMQPLAICKIRFWESICTFLTLSLLYLLLIHTCLIHKMICGRVAPGSCFQLSFLWIRLGLIDIWKDGRIQQRKGQESCKYWLLQIRRWRLRLFCLHTQSLSHDGARARGGNLIMTSIWSPLPATLLVSHSVNLI